MVDRLPLERYLLGLNEVPLDWPEEALEAQAVAARTYALWTLGRPPAGAAATYGFDICASVQCQVFAGADVVTASGGRRWRDAVDATAGEVLVHEGEPILARYHSTSGGTTFANSDVFTTESDYPYLQPVRSTTERASPLYRWRVRFTTRQMQEILATGGLWNASLGALRRVHSIPSRSGRHYDDVVLTGSSGRLVVTAQELREVVGLHAPQVFPARFPSRGPTASGRLPETFPSNRFAATTRRDRVTFIGRGWGHGVGMSQWGAYGLARRGASYRDILTHYYTGVSIGRRETSRPIDVGVAWGRQRVTLGGRFDLVDDSGRVLARDAVGSWELRWSGSGAVAVIPSAGYRLALDVGVIALERSSSPGARVPLTFGLSKAAEVTVRLGDGTRLAGPDIFERGRHRIVLRAPRVPGRYRVVVEASAGGRSVASDPRRLAVADDDPPEVRPPPEQPLPTVQILLLAGALFVALTALAVTMRQ